MTVGYLSSGGIIETGEFVGNGIIETVSVAPTGFEVYFIPTQEIKTMKKNVAGQVTGVQLINSADGTAFTGTATVLITIDGGTQSASGGTGPTHEGNGYHTYLPTQAETNGDQIGFTYTGSGAVTSTVQVYTTFPQSVDNNTILATLPIATDIVSAGAITTLSGAIVNVDLVDTTTTNTDMRGTDLAALASVCTEGRLAELDAANIPADIDAIPTTAMRGTDNAATSAKQDTMETTLNAIPTTAMRGTDGANTTTPPTTAQIWAETTRVLTAGTNLNDLSSAQVNAEMLDVLVTDTFTEVTVPSATASIKDMIHYTFSRVRNKTTQTATTLAVRNDADSGDLGTATVSDDGTTFTKGEDS